MPKLNRQRKRQKFRYDRNRKRIKKTQEKHRKNKVKVNNDVMKELWNPKESIKVNLESMGVAFDANSVVEQKSTKQKFIQKLKNEDRVKKVNILLLYYQVNSRVLIICR